MELTSAIVNHCRADGTLTAIVPATQINKHFKRDVALPQIYFSPRGGREVGVGIATPLVSVLVLGATPTICSQIHDQLRRIFHSKTNYTLGAAGITTFCNESNRVSPPEEEDTEEPAGFEWQAFYEFTTPQTHGF